MNKCECCNNFEIQAELKVIEEKKSYKLCMNCHQDLTNLRLTKKQFDNLIKSGHKDSEFLLHEDFYCDGEALQPK